MATTHTNRQKAAATAEAESRAAAAAKDVDLKVQQAAMNDFNMAEKQAAAKRQKNKRIVTTGTKASQFVLNPPGISSQKIANGFPPAYGLILATGVIAVIGNASHKVSKGEPGNPVDWFKLIFATLFLAITLGLVDRGSFSGPVRAIAALMLLVAIVYYTPTIAKNWSANANKTPQAAALPQKPNPETQKANNNG